MALGSFLLLLFIFSLIFFAIQRTPAKHRVIVVGSMLLPLALVIRFADFREIGTEAFVAFIAALILNFLFWVLIGRYNPVGQKGEIQVIGMDD
jgi:hypothetical protein